MPVEHFTPVDVNNVGIQFKNGATYDPGTSFGCVGSLEGEPELKTKELPCGGEILASITKTVYYTIRLTAQRVPLAVLRKVFGLTNEGLKEGVYSYGSNSKSEEFRLTADVVDEFEDVTKMIAFPKASNISGFKIQNIENGAEEVASLELEFRAYKDENGKFYYEGITTEVTDATVKNQWHTAFTPELVAEVETP